MPATNGPFDLAATPIHLGADGFVPITDFGFDGPSFEAYIEAHCRPGEPGRLVMVETTPGDWTAWECHNGGDELVIVLEGRGTFLQEIDGETKRIAVGPGTTVLNPRGVWHTADVTEPLRAIYVTPCPGTESRPR